MATQYLLLFKYLNLDSFFHNPIGHKFALVLQTALSFQILSLDRKVRTT